MFFFKSTESYFVCWGCWMRSGKRQLGPPACMCFIHPSEASRARAVCPFSLLLLPQILWALDCLYPGSGPGGNRKDSILLFSPSP